MHIRFDCPVPLPDNSKLAHLKNNPASGTKILFFSGGSALRGLSRKLTSYTHNSIHIITAFDSGGSSATLREAFQMPAIGDVRARLMDLADQSLQGSKTVYRLFAYRFPKQVGNNRLVSELDKMVAGRHELITGIPTSIRQIICNHLYWFRKYKPANFDLRGACIGNLILSAGYLENQRDLDQVIGIFSKLIGVKGIVRPVTNNYLHLVAELENGEVVVGQHLLTGKEVAPIASGIKKIFITDDLENLKPSTILLDLKNKGLINAAELICYPMGSFFSSILANFLVAGVGKAIAANPCPKVYIPNSGKDPECFNMTVMDQVDALIAYAGKDIPSLRPEELVNFVLVDLKYGNYAGGIEETYFTRKGIKLVNCHLISHEDKFFIDENLLLPILLSMC